MVTCARLLAASFLALSLISCASSQSGGAPLTQAAAPSNTHVTANPPRDHLPTRAEMRMHPNEVVGGGNGRFGVNLGDAVLPNGSKIQSINLGIDQIRVTDSMGNVTIVAQYTSPQVVNVLAYQAGTTTPIALGNVPATTFASMTIVLDNATSNYVGAAGATHALNFANLASQSTSGFGAATTTGPGPTPGSVAVTFNQPFQIAGSMMNVDVDFNALESLLPGANAGTVRTSLSVAQEGYEGAISGVVANASGTAVTNAVVVATGSNGNVAATGVTDANGNFLLHTLVGDTYQITVYNQYVTAAGWTVNSNGSTSGAAGPITGPSITVTPGQPTSAGTLAD